MDNFLFDPNFHRFADFLDIDKYKRDDPNMSLKIAYLYDWSEMKAKSDNFVDILKSLTSLRKELGTTMRGEELVRDLYRWVRLDTETDNMIKQKRAELDRIKEAKEAKGEIKDRVIKRAQEWEAKREGEASIAKQKEEESQKYASKTIKEKQQTSKQLKSSNMEVKEVKNKPLESKEIIWD